MNGNYILIGLLLFYLGYTSLFAIIFNTGSKLFNKKQQLTHNILIWVIPFVWVLILKNLTKPINTKNAKPGNFHESELGFMGNITNESRGD